MKTSELIRLLQQLDPSGELPVYVTDWNEEYEIPVTVGPGCVRVAMDQPNTPRIPFLRGWGVSVEDLPSPRIEIG